MNTERGATSRTWPPDEQTRPRAAAAAPTLVPSYSRKPATALSADLPLSIRFPPLCGRERRARANKAHRQTDGRTPERGRIDSDQSRVAFFFFHFFFLFLYGTLGFPISGGFYLLCAIPDVRLAARVTTSSRCRCLAIDQRRCVNAD